ncbi:MAG: copper resistance CopC/CopD family protein, partial [Jatrophihabitans sp.]
TVRAVGRAPVPARRGMSRLIRFGLTLLALAAGLVLFAPQAMAHAVVVGSDPVDGSRLSSSPTSVTIRFDEPVGLDLGYLRVVDGAGRRVDTGAASHPAGNGAAISVALRGGLGDSSYLASYRVISADSHPIAGSIRYVVGNGALGSGGGPSGSAPVNQSVSSLLAVSHWLSFAGVGWVGGLWLIFTLLPAGQRRPPIRRLIWTGWAAAVLGALGEFVLQGPYAAGSGLGTALHTGLLDDTLHVNAGQLLSVRLVLIGILGTVLTALFAADAWRRPSWAPEVAAIVGVGIVVTYAATGHSQSANPRWLAVLVDALHLTAMIIWLGGLVILLVAATTRRRPAVAEPVEYADELAYAAGPSYPAGGPGYPTDGPDDQAFDTDGPDDQAFDTDELSAGLPIFSRIAMACVATLAVTGTLQAWREIGTVHAITTTYGRLVLVKVALFCGLLTLGYFARRSVARPRLGRSSLSRLRRTLITEVTVGATVLAVTGVLIAQPPGRVALAAERGKARSTTVTVTAQARAVVRVDPGVHGNVQISIDLAGGPAPTKVSATASLPAKQLGPIPIPLQAAGPASYSGSGVLLPSAGTWQITITVQTSEFDSTTAVAQLRLY